MSNRITLDHACRLVYEVKTLTGRENWQKTSANLKAHFNSPGWDYDKARDLIRRNVRSAKQTLLLSADTPAIELATVSLLVELVSGFLRERADCKHPRKQRQGDEYYCPDCNRRWEIDGDGDEEYYAHFDGE